MHIDMSPDVATEIVDMLALLRPYDLIDARKIRLGRPHDGGYVMLDDFDGVEAAYSIGINDDASWDADVVARGIPVFQYDHTIDAAPVSHPLMRWRREGLGHIADPERHFLELPMMLAQNGHEDARDLILKCDIEGHERDVFAHLDRSVIDQFRTIVMEWHCFEDMHDAHHRAMTVRAIGNIAATHRLVHVHANNFAGASVTGGVMLPNVLEFTFARRDLGDFVPSRAVFPTSLDMPCDSRRADYRLGSFVFGPERDAA